MNSLLKRQIRKYLEGVDITNEKIEKFLNAVNDTYEANDQDRVLMERAFDLSSAELAEINKTLNEERAQFFSILSGIDEVVYVADPKTHELLYMNDKAKELWGDGIGDKCHTTLQNLDTPCPFCTNNKIFDKNLGHSHIWEFKNTINKRWYRCIDRAIRWPDGRIVRFELAIDINDMKEVEERLKRSINDLETFKKVTLDRELMMADMKDEINKLHRKLGEKEPY